MPKKVRIIVKIIIIALFTLMASFTNSKASDTEKSITFADKELYSLIKEQLQKYNRDSINSYKDDENIIIVDITKIDYLNIGTSGNKITDLSGIEEFTFLESLSITNNYTSDERFARNNKN